MYLRLKHFQGTISVVVNFLSAPGILSWVLYVSSLIMDLLNLDAFLTSKSASP